jgi:S-formylglutathione hydrolase FrmB
MTKSRFFLLAAMTALFTIFFLAGCQDNLVVKKEIKQTERYVILVVESAGISANRIGDAPFLTLNVTLPGSYSASEKSYPVIYFLPGYQEMAGELNSLFKTAIDEAFEACGREAIIVEVTGANKLGGSFYVNSPVTGNWEDFTVRQAIETVEGRFRAIRDKAARGLFGFSMGGFGAANLGMRHPDVYGSVFILSGGLFDENGLRNAMGDWAYGDFKSAYGAAFAPAMDKPEPHADIPSFDGSAADNLVVAKWENGFGNLKGKIAEYLAKKDRLQAIHIEYGTSDGYKWIPAGCEYLARLLKENTIPCELTTFSGGHSITRGTMSGSVIPFFCRNLRFE